ncbi:glycosyltransferase [Fusobacterium perfoetens]|uniref:glycosyltransferase n=1 Tax=Fusobacterium perfoetens TaxID=852 RepID=UPI00068620AF|nr:glycosyltransferase [Fusobacterium perfoetens]
MKKIIFYTDSLIMGGAEKIALDYVKMLVEIGKYEIQLLINEDNGDKGNILIDKIPKNVNYQFIVDKNIMEKLNYSREKKQRNIFYKLQYNYYLLKRRKKREKRIKEILLREKYDCIIDFYNILPNDIIDERVISWQHTTLQNYSEKSLKLFKKRLSKIKYLIVLNEEMKEEVLKIFSNYKDKIKVIYNFFDIEEIERLSLDKSKLNKQEEELIEKDYFFACCRLDKYKGIDILIEAYKILKEKYGIKEKLYIAGIGDQKEILENLVKNYNLEKDIVFLGLQKNPYVWMKNAKFFVHSSYREGLPTVVIEGLIANGIVISSNCPTGPKEILENGKVGVLFSVGNKEELAKKILNILENRELLENYKKEARRRIRDFSKEKISKKILEILK